MSVNFKCLYCDYYFLSQNVYSQHVKYCKELNISTEESNNDISDMVSSINSINEMLSDKKFENFNEILFESLQNYIEKFDTNMSNTLEEFEPKSLTLQDNIVESEVEIKEFLNEAYADLMTLITKYNLSNKAKNSIIKFFNKHLDLSQSPLLKNIKTG
ncbi:hypothetical protein Glove_362g12 [Diversispora epigaea]|uniref:Uncharacterized protein n=1 Tax=Diversispora epigaea TaxID=1348612 RepID=A0A397H9F5_9GLOM|nr:hypothetical protein Glove_362g12 [Diversispora epigaea]